jgi:hypothetical protein
LLDFDDFIGVSYQKRSFGDHQGVTWNVARNEKFGADSPTVDIDVRAI